MLFEEKRACIKVMEGGRRNLLLLKGSKNQQAGTDVLWQAYENAT